MTNSQPTLRPQVAVIIPTLNEEQHIDHLLTQMVKTPVHTLRKIIVADGGSTDKTVDIVKIRSATDDRIVLLDNPHKIQAAGINLAVASLPPEINVIVRIDAHAGYPDNYIGLLTETLEKTGAASVVVRLETSGGNCLQNAIAAVSNGLIGTGGSAHRMGGQSRFVDHGHHAAFKREIFEAAGGYDPSFRANEDAELDYRIRQSGGLIWLDTAISVIYFPRKTLTSLAKQYWRYGIGRAQNFLKHGEKLHLRQLLPPLMTIMVLFGALAGWLFAPLLIFPVGYLAIVVAVALILTVRNRQPCLLWLIFALPAMHIAWGSGFIAKLVRKRSE